MTGRIPETKPSPRFPDSSFKYTPLRHVRVVFISFVQGLFSGAPQGDYHWDEDDTLTEILITNENRLDPEVLQKRPAVVFTRGPIQFHSMGIDDLAAYNFATERKEKAVLVPGTMVINVVSRVQQEAEDLAWVIAHHLWLLRDLMMKQGFFDVGRQPQVGAPSPAGTLVANDAGDEYTVVAITVPFTLAYNSAFTPLGLKIVGGISANLSALYPPAASRGVAFADHEVPVNITTSLPAQSASDAGGKTPDPARAKQVFLPKQPHPLNPTVEVSVRTVRPFERR